MKGPKAVTLFGTPTSAACRRTPLVRGIQYSKSDSSNRSTQVDQQSSFFMLQLFQAQQLQCGPSALLLSNCMGWLGAGPSSINNDHGSNSSSSSRNSCLSGITVADVVWAYGQVVSRAFGGGEVVALAPFIDLLNHKEGAGKPRYLPVWPDVHIGSPTRTAGDGSMRGVQTHPTSTRSTEVDSEPRKPGLWAVAAAGAGQQESWSSNSSAQQLHPLLSAGEELYISYLDGIDSVTAYLTFGFVPAVTSRCAPEGRHHVMMMG